MTGLYTALRAALFGLVAAGSLSLPARAGHFTHDDVIGFSTDGRHFAFTTYGLQRGSGLPFASVFVVDLVQDSWVAGTPLQAQRPESDMAAVEAAPFQALEQVRTEAMSAARPLLEQLAIHRPATVLFARGLGEVHQAPSRSVISRPHPDDPTEPPWGSFTLDLDPVTVPIGADYCPDPSAVSGYRLVRTGADGRAVTLHEDASVPASRGCPVAYRLDAVLSAGYPLEGALGVALISVWRQGFEGLDRHVIAVPVPF
jgi:predicted secreted protein